MLRQIDPPPSDDTTRHCGNCGYDLRAVTAARCPECGVSFDPAGPPVAGVPWLHRRVIGTAAALWGTTWLVMFQTRRLIDEVRRDSAVDMRAAAAFRRICVGVAAASVALSLALLLDRYLPVPAGFVVALLPMLAFFHMTTMLIDAGALDYWPSRASRFTTLHDFAAAPLLLLPLGTLAVLACRLTGTWPTLAVVLSLVILAQWLICTFRYQHGASGRGIIWLLTRLTVSAIVWGSFAWFCFLLIVYAIAFSRGLTGW